MSRLITALAADAPRALKAIRAARAAARARAWPLAAPPRPAPGGLVTVDIDATIVIAHCDKENAAPTWKKTFGFHPLARSPTTAPTAPASPSHSSCARATPVRTPPPTISGSSTPPSAQLPPRTGDGCWSAQTPAAAPTSSSPAVIDVESSTRSGSPAVPRPDRRRHRSPRPRLDPRLRRRWRPRPGAWVAELTGLLDLSGWPPGMRVIARKERPHPGAQLRLTDLDGHRVTASPPAPAAASSLDLELRHRRRRPVRGPDPLRQGHRPAQPALRGFDQNQIWCELVALATDLPAWTQMLALPGTPPAAGNPEAPVPALRRRRAWPAAAAASLRIDAAWPGPPSSPPRSPASPASPPADQPPPPHHTKGQHTRNRNPAARRDNRETALRTRPKPTRASPSGHQPKITKHRG